MILADILGVTIENSYMDENGKFDLKKANVITYSHEEEKIIFFLRGILKFVKI